MIDQIKTTLSKYATPDNIIDTTTGGLAGLTVFIVALMGIVLSYDALYDLARLSAVINPWMIWLWPFMLDSVAVGASIYILWSEWRQQAARYAWGLLIGFTVASVIFNTLHANYEALIAFPYVAGVISSFVAGLPPVAAALTLHLFVVLLRDILKRLSLVATVARLKQDRQALVEERESLAGEVEKLTGKIETLKSDLSSLRKTRRSYGDISEDTKTEAKVILAERPGISGAELGRTLGKSESLGRKLKRELNANGNGKVNG